jgi:uncharacterized protein YgiB involved in biofilm formation
MKRSRFIRLGLMGAGIVILSACGEEEQQVQTKAYETVLQCEKAVDPEHPENGPVNTPDECRAQFEEAAKTHETQAPRYTDKALCEEEFGTGNCESRPGSSDGPGFFMPLMAGYMLGSALGGNTVSRGAGQDCDPRVRDCRQGGGTSGGAAPASRSYYSTPLYRPYANGVPGAFTTPNGTSLGTSRGGPVVTGASAFRAAPGATVVSRGGFGARATAVASLGS